LTAGKLPEVDYQTVLGTLMMSSGRHYWEIKVTKDFYPIKIPPID